MDPSKNQVSSKSLSDDANRLNMKKVQVNTQVRAMISFLEAASQITHIFLLWYNKGTHPSNLTLAIIIYDIFLPHSFLMNTSQNKNRIIELGWKNVFKNLIGMKTNVVHNEEGERPSKRRKILNQEYTVHILKKNRNILHLSEKQILIECNI